MTHIDIPADLNNEDEPGWSGHSAMKPKTPRSSRPVQSWSPVLR